MWLESQNWLYPFYGQFEGIHATDYFLVLWESELCNQSEMFLALVFCAGVLLFKERDLLRRAFSVHKTAWQRLLGAAALLLWALAGALILERLVNRQLPWTGWSQPKEYIISGIVILLAGYMLWRWLRMVQESDPLFHRSLAHPSRKTGFSVLFSTFRKCSRVIRVTIWKGIREFDEKRRG